MPAADVQYVLDGSLESGHISGDTHFYLMEIATNSNQLMDAHEQLEHPPADSHWQSLMRMGLYFEQHYVNWRATNPAEAKLASLQGLRHIPQTFREFAQTCASRMAERGHRTLDRAALEMLDRAFEFETTKQVMRRTMQRAANDFHGAGPQELSDIRLMVEGRYEDNRRAHHEAIQRLQQDMRTQVDNFWVNTTLNSSATNAAMTWRNIGGAPENYRHDEAQFKKTQRMLRERKAEERKVLKRSIKFLSKLVGNDTTRMFIGGDGIRFEGRHAIYEMKKMSDLMSSHGGFRALSVYHKEHPDMLLCNLCIYTDGVPLLDHIASLILHIQSGNEEEILKIGNARQIHDEARALEWLAPHLPKPFDRSVGIDVGDFPRLFERDESPAYRRKRERVERETARLRTVVARHIYDEVLADFMPLVRAAGLRIGYEPYHGAANTVVLTTTTNATNVMEPFVVQTGTTQFGAPFADSRFCTHATAVEILNRPPLEPLIPA